MWREFIRGFASHCHFSEAATPAEIAALELELGVKLPPDLHALLEETDGADVSVTFPGMGDEAPMRLSLVWSVAETLKENRAFRAFDTQMPGQFPPLSPLLFFASEPNGDPVAFQTTGGTGIVRMSHEDYGERTVRASSLREYLARFLGPVAEAETGSV